MKKNKSQQVDFKVDWKDSPILVMTEVDHCLKKFGLEVIEHHQSCSPDSYAFSIREIGEKK